MIRLGILDTLRRLTILASFLALSGTYGLVQAAKAMPPQGSTKDQADVIGECADAFLNGKQIKPLAQTKLCTLEVRLDLLLAPQAGAFTDVPITIRLIRERFDKSGKRIGPARLIAKRNICGYRDGGAVFQVRVHRGRPLVGFYARLVQGQFNCQYPAAGIRDCSRLRGNYQPNDKLPPEIFRSTTR